VIMKIFLNGIDLSDSDLKCLQNDLINVEDWVKAAIAGKINNCRKRLLSEWHPRLLADPEVKTVPGDETVLISFITARTDYQNRYEREELIGTDTA